MQHLCQSRLREVFSITFAICFVAILCLVPMGSLTLLFMQYPAFKGYSLVLDMLIIVDTALSSAIIDCVLIFIAISIMQGVDYDD